MDPKVNINTFVVNEASIKNNNLPMGEYQMNPKIQRTISKSDNQENLYLVDVRVEIRNTPEIPFPIDLVASISGVFNVECDNEEEIQRFLMFQGFQIVFPHLRSLVSNMTTNAMMPPIFLPIIFADQFDDVE